MVFAMTRPCSSETPSMSTLRPGISTVLAMNSFRSPSIPLLSFVFVSSVRTTVVFPFGPFTTRVSPVREIIIPFVLTFSPSEENVDLHVNRHTSVRITAVAVRFLCMACSVTIEFSIGTRPTLSCMLVQRSPTALLSLLTEGLRYLLGSQARLGFLHSMLFAWPAGMRFLGSENCSDGNAGLRGGPCGGR